MLSRRRFVQTATVVSGGLFGFPAVGQPAETLQRQSGQRPRHIIHMVADGMSPGTFTCGELLSQLVRERGLTWTTLYNRPSARFGLMNMRSLNSYVTDSSAASSSWGSGSRVVNGTVNQLPDGRPLKTLYELFLELGWKRGLVTTTEITHATPAGFVASVDKRDTGSAIAVQYLERKVDVLLGGGQKFFSPKTREDKRDLYAEYARAGYFLMLRAGQLDQASLSSPWLGTFALSHLPFSLDRQATPEVQEDVPTLATMTRRALDWLQGHEHFILQIEGGRVDHGAHNNDAAAAVHELIAFDQALDVVLTFQEQVPDTLVVITTDHGTGELALNGMGTAYSDSIKLFKNLLQVQCSFPEILRRLRRKTPDRIALEDATIRHTKEEDEQEQAAAKSASNGKSTDHVPSAQEVIDILYTTTGFKLSEHRAGLYVPYLTKKGDPLYRLMNSDMAQLGQLLANYLGIGWTGTAHTADFVPILALGPGSERFGGYIQNVDIFRHYTELAGIRFQNPQGEEVAHAALEPLAVEDVAEYG